MKKWKIPVTWESYGIVEIEANTLEEALKIFDEDPDSIELPKAEYVDASFEREADETIIALHNIII